MQESCCELKREKMNSDKFWDLDIQNATLSAGYKINGNNEIAVQQDLKVSERAFGNFSLGLRRRFSNSFESKLKIDCSSIVSSYFKYQLNPNVNIGASVQTSALSKSQTNGFLNQPLNFGLRITHNN
jgi:hypothetical protein